MQASVGRQHGGETLPAESLRPLPWPTHSERSTGRPRSQVPDYDAEADAAAALLLHATERDDLLLMLETLEHCRRQSDQFLIDAIKRSRAVHMASQSGYDALLVNLLSIDDTSAGLANASLESGETPLYLACSRGHLTTVRCLIDLGATCDPGPVDSSDRMQHLFSVWSPHRAACCAGHLQIFNLLESEFESEWTSEELSTFLALACTSNSVEMVKKFIGASDLNLPLFRLDMQVNGSNDNAKTGLEIALSVKSIDVAAFLISAGAEFTSTAMSSYPDASSDLLHRFVSRRQRDSQAPQSEQDVYDICWHQLHLHDLDIGTLMDFYDHELGAVDISHNHIKELPPAIPWNLGHIRLLNASSNEIARLCWPLAVECGLSDSAILCTHLTEINLSRNQLTSVPTVIFMLPALETLNLSHNKLNRLCTEDASADSVSEARGSITSIDTVNSRPASRLPWKCVNLHNLDVSHNELDMLPMSLNAAVALERLLASSNHLRKFVPSWPAPLSVLNLSHNWLSSSPIISANTWETTLATLTLNGNRLEEVHLSIFQLEFLRELDLSFNRLAFLPPSEQWKLASLVKLDLSHNRLIATLPSKSDKTVSVLEFPSCLHSHLMKLNVGFNRLTSLPLSVTRLRSLEELDISGNIGLKELPYEVSNMRALWILELGGLALRNLPLSLWSAPAKSIVEYYGEQYTDAVPSNRLKVVIVGSKGHGKTSLAYALRRKKPPADLNYGKAEIMPWTIDGKGTDPNIEVSLWDLPGDSETANIAQCFMTTNALYIVVCNLLTLSSGNTGLDDWLRNIQSGAPDSHVIIVGTHADAFKEGERRSAEEKLKAAVSNLCMAQGDDGCTFVRSCYPHQQNKHHLSVVVCSGREPRLSKAPISSLQDRIRSLALEMRVHGQKQPLLKRKVPRVFNQLREAVCKEAAARPHEPLLTTREFQELVLQQAGSVQVDPALAAQYLHESGCLLHFPNHLRGLNELYFVNPAWLYGVLAKIFVQTTGPVLTMDDARQIFLKDATITREMFEKYLELMEKFEIVLCMDHSHSERLLVPSKLPSKPPIETEDHNRVHRVVRRCYRLQYVPVSFWSRFIVRVLNGLYRLSCSLRDSVGSGMRGLCPSEGFVVSDKREVIYWNSGMRFVDSMTGCFFTAETLKDKPNDISLTVYSERGDYGAMGFLVDQVTAVIEEWHPELLHYSGSMRQHEVVAVVAVCPGELVQQQIGAHAPCPVEATFTIEECVLALMQCRTSLPCGGHPDAPVPLSLLVPDLLMADLPLRYKLIPELVRPDLANPLGKGGQAAVYQGQYGRTPLAYKLCYCVSAPNRPLPPRQQQEATSSSFDSGISSQGAISYASDSLAHDLVAKNNLSAIAAVRQEAMMLLRLQHPCLLKLIGVSLWACGVFAPCTALELAPLGDLRSVLDDAIAAASARQQKGSARQPTWKRPPLGRELTYRILCQVANALRYLHATGIVYRDLKSDNVLVWSLAGFDESGSNSNSSAGGPASRINVKLSDYGLSRVVTSQGARGNEGTPAYQAPEVMPGLAYNEKVDIFSMGMFTYELLSGRRPYNDLLTNLLTREAIQGGERPKLYEAPHRIFPDMHCLTQLLPQLWVADQRLRPSSMDIVRQLHSVTFYGLVHCTPQLPPRLPDQPTFIEWPSTAHYNQEGRSDELWLWSGTDEARRLHLFDPDLGVFTTGSVGISHPGRMVRCMLVVNSQIFLALQSGCLEIFASLADDSPAVFSLQGSPTFLFHFKASQASPSLPSGSHELVYCGLSNGVLCVLGRLLEDDSKWGCVCQIKLNKRGRPFEAHHDKVVADASDSSSRGTGDSTLPQPATCMCKVANGEGSEELWVGFGLGVCIISALAEVVGGCLIDYIAIKSRRQLLPVTSSCISSMCQYGGSVFAAMTASCKVYQLSTKLRVTEYIIVAGPETTIGNVLVLSSDVDELQTGAGGSSDLQAVHLRNVYGSVKKKKQSQGSGKAGLKSSSGGSSASNSAYHVSSIVVVKDTLWLGIASGDILIVNMNSEGGHSFRYSYGEIIAILRPPNESMLLSPMFLSAESQKRIICLYTAGKQTGGWHPAKICVWEPLGTANIISLNDWWPSLLGGTLTSC